MEYFILVILGLAAGSFLNVVIYRLPRQKGFLKGRSFCPHCRHTLGPLDLIPVLSFIFLKGRCRYCGKPIDWQYPLVELATALIFVALYLKFALAADFFVYLLYSLILLVIFVIDLRYYLILDKISVTAIILAFFLGLFVIKIALWQMLLAGIIGGGFFLLQFLVSRGKWIGGGDIRLGILMGFMLGAEKLLLALLVSYLVGAVTGIMLIIFGKKHLKSKVPFGTFLSISTFIVILWGEQILNLYWTKFF